MPNMFRFMHRMAMADGQWAWTYLLHYASEVKMDKAAVRNSKAEFLQFLHDLLHS